MFFKRKILLHTTILPLSGCRDSNPESPVPKTGMLAVTPQPDRRNIVYNKLFSTKTILYNSTLLCFKGRIFQQ